MTPPAHVEALQAKVRLCWPLRHGSPLHACALRLNLDRLQAAELDWSMRDAAGWLRWVGYRQREMERRRWQTTS